MQIQREEQIERALISIQMMHARNAESSSYTVNDVILKNSNKNRFEIISSAKFTGCLVLFEFLLAKQRFEESEVLVT